MKYAIRTVVLSAAILTVAQLSLAVQSPTPEAGTQSQDPESRNTTPTGSGAGGTYRSDQSTPSASGTMGSGATNGARRMNGRKNGSDDETLRAIREAILPASTGAGMGMSTAPEVKDLKVYRKDGKVTLTGKVMTVAEKEAIGERATTAAGGEQIDNQLKVEAPK